MAVRSLRGRSERLIPASLEECFAVLAGVERWPDWISTLRSLEVLESDSSGRPSRVAMEARVLGLTLALAATVEVTAREGVAIRRVPHGDDDPERFELVIALADVGGGARASAELSAQLEVPRLLPLPGVAADQAAARVLADLERRLRG
ncbi:MAG: Polyketide cyclase / dehydrase and lipid transport, partial [Thermoleophilaceae bacterium]|nr:Polyketide cyclase / dehydrase and lipid transport [Thermoleophilaceae bacterium]